VLGNRARCRGRPTSAGDRDCETDSALAANTVQLVINGPARHLTLDPRTTLLMRCESPLRLTGTMKGCDHGQCGACPRARPGDAFTSCLLSR